MGKLLKIAGGSYTEVAGSILDHAREGGITHTSTGKINFNAGGDIVYGEYEAPEIKKNKQESVVIDGWWTDKKNIKKQEAEINDIVRFHLKTKNIKDGETLKLTLRDWDGILNIDDYPKGAPTSITINGNKGYVEFTIPKRWESDIFDDSGAEIELYFDIKYKGKSYELPSKTDDYLKVHFIEVKITLLIELPHSLETGWAAKGLAGHTAMAIGNDYFDYGPDYSVSIADEKKYDYDFNDDGDKIDMVDLSGYDIDFKFAPGRPWWGEMVAFRKGIDARKVKLSDVISFILPHWSTNNVYGKVYKIEFYVNKSEADEMLKWWETRYKYLKVYSVYPWTGEQCTTTTKLALQAGGLFIPDQTQTPKGILSDMKRYVKSTSYKHKDQKPVITVIKKESIDYKP